MRGAGLRVLKIGPLATIQDRGRPGFAAAGVPRGGAWDLDTLRAALAAVEGADDDAAIELPLLGATFLVEGAAVASIDGAKAIVLTDGDTLEVPRCERAVRYVALRGGVEVPRVLGARATLTVAHLGGIDGRPLRVGDRLAIGAPHRPGEPSAAHVPAQLDDAPLECLPAANGALDALDALCARAWRIDPRSDRVGTRLDGAPLDRVPPRVRSRPLVRGAIQLPPDGRPIVIGPDGPTTGGYPVLAVLGHAACSSLAQRRPGATVRFVIARSPLDARRTPVDAR